MTADEIKALVERLRDRASFVMQGPAHILRTGMEAADALESLSDQLLAKTELATLYAASLRKVEDDAARYRWLRDEANGRADLERAPLVLMTRDDCSNDGWKDVLQGDALDAAIDAARLKGEEKP